MNKLTIFISFLTLLFFISPLEAQVDPVERNAEIERLSKLVNETRAGWQVGDTSMARLPLIEFQKRLGLMESDQATYVAPPVLPRGETLPSYVNWKDKGHVTRIKDQGSCGSCYAFASCALLESYFSQKDNVHIDLSEQYFMMKAKFWIVGGCNGGALWVCQLICGTHGVPLEEFCPYKAVEESCPGGNPELYKKWCWPSGTIDGFKVHLAKDGPIVAGFTVYEDFRYYRGGVYKYVQGKVLGGHAILIIGYNDAEQYWIVKNSWGNDWGESCNGQGGEAGYFRIGYGECGIENFIMGPFFISNPNSK